MSIIQSFRGFMQPDDEGKASAQVKKSETRVEPAKPAPEPEKKPSKSKRVAEVPPVIPTADKSSKKESNEEKPAMLIKEGTAPKAAVWKTLPAAEEWCPPALAAKYPELKAHVYEDNASVECVLANGWRVAAATRRGKQHAHTGTHREDAFRFRNGPNHSVLCVADGAGSAKWSRLGSHLAVSRVTEYITAQLEKLPADLDESKDGVTAFLKTHFAKAVDLACVALREAASASNAAPRDFRCTLLTVAHFRGKSGDWLVANQIGDGAISILFQDKSTKLLCGSDSGEFSGEVACFVPDDCARLKASQIDVIAPENKIECVLLCSDGIEDPFYPMQKRACEVFAQVYGGVKERLPDFAAQSPQPAILSQDAAGWALGQWLGFEKRGENDDRSILLFHRFPTTVSF